MSKNELNKGILTEKEHAPQTHAHTDLPPEGEPQTTEGNFPEKLQECHPIADPCLHVTEGNACGKIEGNPVPTHHERPAEVPVVQATESKKTDLSTHLTHEDGSATETKPPSFTHKIGKTTYHVNMHFSETATESLLDKIKRMLINDFNNI